MTARRILALDIDHFLRKGGQIKGIAMSGSVPCRPRRMGRSGNIGTDSGHLLDEVGNGLMERRSGWSNQLAGLLIFWAIMDRFLVPGA